jgi:hypothetical protein
VAGTYTWQEGDFTYDSLVNFDDILALFPNYGAPDYLAGSLLGGGFSASGMAEGDEGLLGLFAGGSGTTTGGISAVPEPTGPMLLAASLVAFVARLTSRRGFLRRFRS